MHRVVKYRQSAVIFSQGTLCSEVMYLQHGAVKLSVLSRTDKEAIVSVLQPGDFFGEGCLAGHDRSTTTQQAFLEFHRYLQAVRDRVLERIIAGKSLAEIRKEVTMADFKDYNQTPARVITDVDTTYDYLWRYREPTDGGPQMPVRAPRD